MSLEVRVNRLPLTPRILLKAYHKLLD